VGCDWEAKWVAGEAAVEGWGAGLVAVAASAGEMEAKVAVVGEVAVPVAAEAAGEEEVEEARAAAKVPAAEARSEPSIPQWHRLLEWTRLR